MTDSRPGVPAPGGGAPRDRAWAARALAELEAVLDRDVRRLARRLGRQHRLDDPRALLAALAARRLLPLGASVARPLPPGARGPEARAFARLAAADRAVLLADGWAAPGAREHLASALARLTRNAQAARRSPDAPPG